MKSIFAWLALIGAPVAGATNAVAFDWFEYVGRDAVFERPLPPDHYRNPILTGFYPDPSITRAGDRFYLVASTFTYFPGIPIFESTDLVHWRQLGHVIDRPSQLSFEGLGISRGVFAPTIEYHDGIFYVFNTAVDTGGNFYVTATNPAGPWSDPIWLPSIDGIDPSVFFDTDGKVYLLNNGPPEGPPQYDGHRAIWIQELDLKARQPVGPRKILVNGGVDFSKKPIWIEGPHIYKLNGWYYLMCAEGGTGPNHSQVILRSRSVWGPYEPGPHNPILTQRDLDPHRPDPITNAGHADLVQGPDGSWWATFLATRTYDDGQYNTGRETFLLPVVWENDWPIILHQGRAIPYVERAPSFLEKNSQAAPLTGNFTWRDEFDRPSLDFAWMNVRVPKEPWWDLKTRPGWLVVNALPVGLESLTNPSFLARRQQHITFEASTAFETPPPGIAAGLAAFQSEDYWYYLGVRRAGEQLQIFLERKGGDSVKTVAAVTVPAARQIRLKVTGAGARYSFFHATDTQDWTALRENEDGTLLSTKVAGGFVGVVLGPYARAE